MVAAVLMPRAYYNEIDLHAAEWLYNLQRENLIAPGDIDTRPIQDVRPSDLGGYTQCHFFAGIGGWSLALRRAGWPDHRKVWTGSCPCQPFSSAGRRLGFADDRHLWPFWRYLIAVGRPATILGEQVASAADWLGLVRGDLETLGYALGAMPVEAASAGADHLRDRYWLVADDAASRERRGRVQRSGESSPASGERASDKFAGSGFDGSNVADGDDARSQGWDLSAECPDQRAAGANGVAHAQHMRQSQSQGCESDIGRRLVDGSESEWVLGADGKQRRVKSGVCLLVNGISVSVRQVMS